MNHSAQNSNTGKPPSRVAVLGAGLAGLRGADVLSEAGAEVMVVEKRDAPGGLASTISRDNFRFDLGPHRFHTEKPHILQFVSDMLADQLISLERLSRIRLLDRYFLYPLSFGDVLGKMPIARSMGMMLSYARQRLMEPFRRRDAIDFQDWVTRRFGRKLYDLYFGPYTGKLWGLPPESLSADWASQRITVPRLTDLARATLFPRSSSARSLVSRFHYPKGGIGRIAETLAERVRSRGGTFFYSSSPRAIIPSTGGGYRILMGDGDLEVDAILSSIPVSDYVTLLGELMPEDVRKCAGNLSFRAIMFVVLRLGRPIQEGDHWIYTPEEKYLFNRISFPGNFDPAADRNGGQAVFEFTCRKGDEVWSRPEALVEAAISGGIALGLFRREDVLDSESAGYEHAYPIYTLDYRRNITPVLNTLDELKGSVTCGRQGLFRYNNMDHSLEMGEFAALELLGRGKLKERFRWTGDMWADG